MNVLVSHFLVCIPKRAGVMMNMKPILVVKLGGGQGLDMARCLDDLAVLAGDYALVVVHGISHAVNELCQTRGISVQTITSPTGHTSRYTTPEVRDIFVEASHRVTGELVTGFASRGLTAAGMTNTPPLIGERKTALRALVDGKIRMIRDDYSGSISNINTAPIYEAVNNGIIPILPPLADSPDGLLNVDGDRASAYLAGAICADQLIILSNVRGLYQAYPDENTFIPRVHHTEMNRALDWAQGRMKRKVLGAQEALQGGVRRVVIGDGRIHAPVSSALNGAGTEFVS